MSSQANDQPDDSSVESNVEYKLENTNLSENEIDNEVEEYLYRVTNHIDSEDEYSDIAQSIERIGIRTYRVIDWADDWYEIDVLYGGDAA